MCKLLTLEEAMRAFIGGKEVEYMALGHNNKEIGWTLLTYRSFVEQLFDRKFRLKPQKIKKYKFAIFNIDDVRLDTFEKYTSEEIRRLFPYSRIQTLFSTEEEFDE